MASLYVDSAYGLNRVRLTGGLVRPVALHAGEPECQPGRVARALLHAVEGYLDDKLRAHVYGIVVPRNLELL